MLATTLAAAAFIVPTLAVAQTATSSPYHDSAGTTPLDWQHIRGWRDASTFQAQLQILGATPVTVLPVPVLFGVVPADISPNFGDPRDGGARKHQGEDLMAVKGTPIVSPTAAVVLRTVTGPDEGNAVYTANPGGETFIYMHLDRFGEGVVAGEVLAAGSLIGYVGNTGNASGGAAHLHFEIHSSASVPIDPYPRLTAEFTPAQKISFLTAILTITADPASFSQFLVTNFRSEFVTSIGTGVILPPQINSALASLPMTTAPTTGTTSSMLPTGDLQVGSAGAAVTTLQKYLIQANTGPAAVRLSKAGATGNFGTLTKAALIEFQAAAVSLTAPATGYYGAATRTYIEAHPLGAGGTGSVSSGTVVSVVPLTRDLHLGMSGTDVLTLQRTLNARGYIVAITGSGSVGNETNYFGPATKAAVIKFQLAKNIQPSVGYVGALTRAALLK